MALTAKYRPQKLSELVGHPQIVKYFKNAIIRDSLHSAYLFSGFRGTGKTSLSRVLAKSLNCETGITLEPCGECKTCKHIQSSDALGVFEIDCASNNGVDYIRQIAETASIHGLLGFHYRYKIYILDEAHNLTKQAFDALLKTIEEPGTKTLFILVTTELAKVPDTIKSRCQTFNFSQIDTVAVTGLVNKILAEENIAISKEIIEAVVEAGDGIIRETLTLLDKVALSDISTVEEFHELLGKPAPTSLIKLLDSTAAQNYQEVYRELKTLGKQSDPTQLLKDIANFVRNAIASYQKLDYKLMTCDSATFKTAHAWGKKYPIQKLIEAQILLREADTALPKSPYSHLEATLLKLSLVFQNKPALVQQVSYSQPSQPSQSNGLVANPWYGKDALTEPLYSEWGDLCQHPLMVKLRTNIVSYQWNENKLTVNIPDKFNKPAMANNIKNLLADVLAAIGKNSTLVEISFINS